RVETAVTEHTDAATVDTVLDEVRHGPVRAHGGEGVAETLHDAVEAHAAGERAEDGDDRCRIDVDVEVAGRQGADGAHEAGVAGEVRLCGALEAAQHASQDVGVARRGQEVTSTGP